MIASSISLRSQRCFSPFPRGTSSLSVTDEYLALRRGRRGFMRNFAYVALLRDSLLQSLIRHETLTLSGRSFQNVNESPTSAWWGPSTPLGKPRGLGCSGFARHYSRNRLFLSLPLDTEMFHFSRCRSCLAAGRPCGRGYPIRKSSDRSVIVTPRSLSQLVASFIACQCQGIHHVLFLAILQNYLSMQLVRPARGPANKKKFDVCRYQRTIATWA